MNHVDLIKRDAKRLRYVIAPLVDAGQRYALVDFPDHSNVGDSAIWIGEEALLRDMMHKGPSYVSTVEGFDAASFQAACPNGVIFLHGGGNFGDIYPKHQLFRERIISEYPDRLIIQLPQSIKYRAASGIGSTAQVIATHPRFHLLVRDEASLALARGNFSCPTTLVPDAAFAMGPLQRSYSPEFEMLFMLRQDVERVEHDLSPFNAVERATMSDWVKEPSDFRAAIRRKSAIRAILTGQWSRNRRRAVYYHDLAAARLARGLALLGNAKIVITDRLHSHILCTLLDVPHVAMDNDYGKIHSYIAAWTSDYDAVKTALTPNDALASANQLRTERLDRSN